MTLSRVKPAGWSYGEILTSTQANTMDENIAKAVDGVGGGTYTLSNPLRFEDEDIEIGENLIVDGDIEVNDLEVGDDLHVLDDVTVEGASLLKGGTVVQTSLICTGSTSLNSDATIGASNSDALTVNATTTVAAPVAFNRDVTLGSDINDIITVEGTPSFVRGVVVPRAVTIGSTSNTTYQAASTSLVYADTLTTTPTQYTIGDTDAVDGMMITFVYANSDHSVQVRKPNGDLLIALLGENWVDVIRVEGEWRVARYGSLP